MTQFRKLSTISLFLVLYSGAQTARAQSLTTVRDTVNNADGSKFYGRAIVSWQGFTAATGATVAPHSVSLTITNGYLSIDLVPTTNASSGAFYTVQYASNDGIVLWTEYWQVPPSSTPLTLNQVRVSSPPNSGGGSGDSGGSGPISLPITENNVTNLLADLAARPTTASVYTPSRTAMIDPTGSIASVSGNTSDCVHVDGTSGPCGTAGSVGVNASFVDNELPSGTQDGTNVAFTLSQTPSPASSLSLFRNGINLRQGLDYSLSANAITFVAAQTPQAGDVLTAFYRVTASPITVVFADAEVPSGTIDGSNAAFALAAAPSPAASLQLFKNGALLRSGTDYTLAGNTVTFTSASAPRTGDHLEAFYRH